MSDQPQRVRWHYPDSEVVSPDRVVEGSPDKFRELQATVGNHPHGEPELVEGEVETPNEPEGPFVCGAELSSGGECSREVDAPDGRCWQHGG